MKKYLLIVTGILGFINGWGQSSFNKANHDISEAAGPVLVQIDTRLYIL